MADVIDPQVHERLLADADHICQMANIPKSELWKSAKDILGEVDCQWLVDYPNRKKENRSLVYLGKQDPSVERRMTAMTAALLRNFIDARMVPLNTVLDWTEERLPPDPTVLMIPNLHIQLFGKSLPSWQIQRVYDVLLQRIASNKLTVVYVENLAQMRSHYGDAFASLIEDHFDGVGGW